MNVRDKIKYPFSTLSFEDELSLVDLANNHRGSSREEAVCDEAIEYIARRVPYKSVYEKLVFFLKRGQIVFIVHDLAGQTHFPGKTTGKHDILYFDTLSRRGCLPVFNIHVTKSCFDTKLKNNIEAQAMLILEFYAEKVLVSPLKGTRRQFAREKAKALTDPSKRGLYLDKQRQKELDSALKAGDQEYLFGLINSYDIREDPDRIYIQAIYGAIGRLKNIDIRTGNDLSAWYRYMLESSIREEERWPVDRIILNISNIIREAVKKEGTRLGPTEIKIKKRLIYKEDNSDRDTEDLSEYNHGFVFPYRRADYHNGIIIFIPQSHIELSEKIFIEEQIDPNKDRDSLNAFTEDIKVRASEENSLNSNLETGLKHPDDLMAARKIIQAAQGIVKKRRACEDKRAVVIGVLAPASAGKTSFSQVLTLGSMAMGMKTGYVGCDGYLQPGDGFRYDYDETKDAYRNTHIRGPGIYDDVKIRRVLDHLKQGGALHKTADKHAKTGAEEIGPDLDVIISDGVFIGIDKELLDIIDIFVSLYIDNETEETRLELKWRRDTAEGATHKGIHLPLDFAKKQFHETGDGMRRLIPERADFVWVREQRKLYIRKDHNVAKPGRRGNSRIALASCRKTFTIQ